LEFLRSEEQIGWSVGSRLVVVEEWLVEPEPAELEELPGDKDNSRVE